MRVRGVEQGLTVPIAFEHIDSDDERPDAVEAPAAPSRRESPLDRIRRRKELLRKAAVRDFDVPGYRGDLVVRCSRLDQADQLETYDASANTWERGAQLLLDCCEGLYERDDDGNLAAILSEMSLPAKWPELAALTGEQVTDARTAVLDVFAGNQQALVDFAVVVDRWMGSADERDDEELAGG